MIGTAHRAGRLPSRNRGARTAALGRVAVGGAVRWAGDRVDSRGTADERRQRRGRRIVATIDALVDQLAVMRGAAMKAGQVLSTVEFPSLDEDQSAHLQARLAPLRDGVPAVGWKQMRKVLASDWGEQPERVLEHIDTEPAAAASIGQVYRGWTHDGREVAINVQYPGIAESVEADMRNLLLLSPLLRQLMPGLEVKDVLAELRERIVEECDYELEASNHRRVERFCRGHPFVLEQATVIAGMRELGYLPGEPSEWTASCCSTTCVRSPGGCTPRNRCGSPPEDLWRSTEALRDQDARNHILQLRRMTLPPEALLLRRMEGLLFQTAAMMRKRSRGRLLRELIEGAAPVGELGAQHADWLARHPRLRPARPAVGVVSSPQEVSHSAFGR
jgi:hypothetical protein